MTRAGLVHLQCLSELFLSPGLLPPPPAPFLPPSPTSRPSPLPLEVLVVRGGAAQAREGTALPPGS